MLPTLVFELKLVLPDARLRFSPWDAVVDRISDGPPVDASIIAFLSNGESLPIYWKKKSTYIANTYQSMSPNPWIKAFLVHDDEQFTVLGADKKSTLVAIISLHGDNGIIPN